MRETYQIFTIEKVVWSRSSAVSMEADGRREVQAQMWWQFKQHLLPIETETLPYSDHGHGAHRCPGRRGRRVVGVGALVKFVLAPRPTWQVTRPRQSEGQRGESAGVADTHRYTKTLHQYYKPQSEEHSADSQRKEIWPSRTSQLFIHIHNKCTHRHTSSARNQRISGFIGDCRI